MDISRPPAESRLSISKLEGQHLEDAGAVVVFHEEETPGRAGLVVMAGDVEDARLTRLDRRTAKRHITEGPVFPED